MLGNAYRAIMEKRDGTYETDGYLIIDNMYNGMCRVDSYGPDISFLGSHFQQPGKNMHGEPDISECFPKDDRSYVVMADRDMEDLLAIRKALDHLNRMERRKWGAESRGLDVSFFVRSFSGGKVRVADYTRIGRFELRAEHSTLVRHFVGAAGREGVHALMEEPKQMSGEMYERMGQELQEIADKYGFLCGKDQNETWYLGIQEAGRIRRVLLRLKREKEPSNCMQLSGEAHEIMRDYARRKPSFCQEDAWAFADDLNGLCGRMASPVLPLGKTGHGRNTPCILIGDLLPLEALTAMPHDPEKERVTAWDVRQASIRGTNNHLRDTLIGFLRNMDNAESFPEAMAYLSEMAARYRLDTVRDISGERLQEITSETILLTKRTEEAHIIRRDSERSRHHAPAMLRRANEEKLTVVAEGAFFYDHAATREMAR